MKDDLNIVLEDIKQSEVKGIEHGWKRLSDHVTVAYYHPSTVFLFSFVYQDNKATYKDQFRVYKKKIIYTNYIIDNRQVPFTTKCKEVHIRNNIKSEEEYFQESTLYDLNGLIYDDYIYIQQISDEVNSWMGDLWND